LLRLANGPRYGRRVGLDSFVKRKSSKPESTEFGGAIPAVRVHALLACFWHFRLDFSPEIFVRYSFALSNLLFRNLQNALEFW
jgi:hypothetical protein